MPGGGGCWRARGPWRLRDASCLTARLTPCSHALLPPPAGAWKRYFDRINKDSLYNNAYVASEDEAAEGGAAGAGVAFALAAALAPLALFAAIKALGGH